MPQSKKTRWRPRFTLAALLVLITVVAIPLSYVAQRRAWNLRRKAAYETLVRKQLVYGYDGPEEAPHFALEWWRQLLQEGSAPQLTGVNYDGPGEGSTKPGAIGDADLQLLAHFPEIESIRFMGPTRVTDSGMRIIARLPRLEYLWVHEMPGVSGEFIRDFDSSSVLKTLELRLDDLRGENLAGLRNLSALKTLSIESAAKLDEDSLKAVELPSNIEDLTLVFTRSMPEEPMSRWIRSCRLRSFQGCAMSANAAQALESQIDLRKLILFDSPLADDDLRFLSQCKELNELWLSAMPIRGKFLETLGHLRALRELRLDNTLMEDAYLDNLRQFQYLYLLDLRWTPLTGEGFAATGAFPLPKETKFMGTQFSDAGKAALCACDGIDTTWHLELPSNWELGDFRYFIRYGRPPDRAILPIGAAHAAGSTMKKFYRHYSASYDCQRSRDSFGNSPADVMAPVLRLRELARAKLQEEMRQDQELAEMEHLYYQERGLIEK